jgi:hypothetical protein
MLQYSPRAHASTSTSTWTPSLIPRSPVPSQASSACQYAGSILTGDEGKFDSCTSSSSLPTPLLSIRIPPGATSISYDRIHARFVVSFNSASDGVCSGIKGVCVCHGVCRGWEREGRGSLGRSCSSDLRTFGRTMRTGGGVARRWKLVRTPSFFGMVASSRLRRNDWQDHLHGACPGGPGHVCGRAHLPGH